MTDIVIIYVTTSGMDEAVLIGEALISERLAGCVNILPVMNSIYRWEGKVRQEKESVLVVKTRKGLYKKAADRIKELHSYSCPCILQLSVPDGNKKYIQWLLEETKK